MPGVLHCERNGELRWWSFEFFVTCEVFTYRSLRIELCAWTTHLAESASDQRWPFVLIIMFTIIEFSFFSVSSSVSLSVSVSISIFISIFISSVYLYLYIYIYLLSDFNSLELSERVLKSSSVFVCSCGRVFKPLFWARFLRNRRET